MVTRSAVQAAIRKERALRFSGLIVREGSLPDSKTLPRRVWPSRGGTRGAYGDYRNYDHDKHPPVYPPQSWFCRFDPFWSFLPFRIRPIDLHHGKVYALRPANDSDSSRACSVGPQGTEFIGRPRKPLDRKPARNPIRFLDGMENARRSPAWRLRRLQRQSGRTL